MSQLTAGHSNLLHLFIAIICTHTFNVVYDINSQKRGKQNERAQGGKWN